MILQKVDKAEKQCFSDILYLIQRLMIHAFVIFQVPISHFADHCHRRLERAQATGAKRGVRKPTMDEIEQAKVSLEASKFIYTQSMVW